MKIKFWVIIFAITCVGFILRLTNYDKLPPFLETIDEVMYPWAGISFLKTGTPTSWSLFPAYTNVQNINLWDHNFRIVTPWIEKPPIYPLLSGTMALIFGQNKFEEINISTIRVLPLILSIFSIILLILFTEKIFSKPIALIAGLLYATIPTIVIANRLSLSENLIIPLSLAALLLLYSSNSKNQNQVKPLLIGLLCGLAIITRQAGVALPIAVSLILFTNKDWKTLKIVIFFSLLFLTIHPIIGAYYNWDLYLNILKDYKNAYSIGLPQVVANIFRFPSITYQFAPILDGSMLAGYILLFSFPFISNSKEKNLQILTFPLIYLLLLVFMESGKDIFGWHLFPLFPFLAIILAGVFYDTWQKPDIFKSIILFLIIGSSSFRFILILFPQLQHVWQKLFFFIFFLTVVHLIINNKKFQRTLILITFFVFVLINVLIALKAELIYPNVNNLIYANR